MPTRIVHNLGDLERDMRRNAVEFKPRAAEQVRDVAREGNRAGRRNAKVSSGSHGKLYPRSFTTERRSPLEWEWGPDASKSQGGMAVGFERGSRNQTAPHHDIAKAADQHGADDLQSRVNRLVLDRLFW